MVSSEARKAVRVCRSRPRRPLCNRGDTAPRTNLVPPDGSPNFSIAAGLGSVWITDLENHTLVRIDPKTDAVIDRIRLRVHRRPSRLPAGACGSP